MNEERKGVVTLKGNPLTVVGPELKAGDSAPAFTVAKGWNAPVQSSEFAGKLRFINVIPSIETGICDAQTKRFNDEAAKLPNVEWLTLSADMPQALTRWCGATGVANIKLFSDLAQRDFGTKYGVFVKELGVLQRSVFIIGKDDKIKYIQRVPEIASHPDYDAALAALKANL
jgi:thiol peroxidase